MFCVAGLDAVDTEQEEAAQDMDDARHHARFRTRLIGRIGAVVPAPPIGIQPMLAPRR